MLPYSLSTGEKSRFDIINPASCSTIKQQPLLNWNYYRFNLPTSHNRNIIKAEFSGRQIILGWVQAFLVLDGWNRFVVKVFKAIFCQPACDFLVVLAFKVVHISRQHIQTDFQGVRDDGVLVQTLVAERRGSQLHNPVRWEN